MRQPERPFGLPRPYACPPERSIAPDRGIRPKTKFAGTAAPALRVSYRSPSMLASFARRPEPERAFDIKLGRQCSRSFGARSSMRLQSRTGHGRSGTWCFAALAKRTSHRPSRRASPAGISPACKTLKLKGFEVGALGPQPGSDYLTSTLRYAKGANPHFFALSSPSERRLPPSDSYRRRIDLDSRTHGR